MTRLPFLSSKSIMFFSDSIISWGVFVLRLFVPTEMNTYLAFFGSSPFSSLHMTFSHRSPPMPKFSASPPNRCHTCSYRSRPAMIESPMSATGALDVEASWQSLVCVSSHRVRDSGGPWDFTTGQIDIFAVDPDTEFTESRQLVVDTGRGNWENFGKQVHIPHSPTPRCADVPRCLALRAEAAAQEGSRRRPPSRPSWCGEYSGQRRE